MSFKKHIDGNLVQQRKDNSCTSETALAQFQPNLGQIPASEKAVWELVAVMVPLGNAAAWPQAPTSALTSLFHLHVSKPLQMCSHAFSQASHAGSANLEHNETWDSGSTQHASWVGLMLLTPPSSLQTQSETVMAVLMLSVTARASGRNVPL